LDARRLVPGYFRIRGVLKHPALQHGIQQDGDAMRATALKNSQVMPKEIVSSARRPVFWGVMDIILLKPA